MKTEIKLITPAGAEELLRKNNLNRQIKERIVKEYSRLMVAGLWKEETGEAIKIAIDGTILDGQHRLIALSKSNISLNFLVITDLNKDIFTVLDTGVLRNAGDILHIAGVANSHNIAAAITKYLKLKKGSISVLEANSNLKDFAISKAELFSVYNNRNKFWDVAIEMSNKWYNKFQRVLSMSEISSLYAFFYDIDENDSFKFMELLCNGTELNKYDPILLLREKLIFSKTNLKFKITPIQKLAVIYKTWNYFRNKESIKLLRFNYDLDKFPVPE